MVVRGSNGCGVCEGGAVIKTSLTNDFELAASAYCAAKVAHLDLKKRVREMRCENLKECEGGSWLGTPCWQVKTWIEPDDCEPLDPEEYCDTCKASLVLVERRREIGRRLAGLATKMYASFRGEGG